MKYFILTDLKGSNIPLMNSFLYDIIYTMKGKDAKACIKFSLKVLLK